MDTDVEIDVVDGTTDGAERDHSTQHEPFQALHADRLETNVAFLAPDSSYHTHKLSSRCFDMSKRVRAPFADVDVGAVLLRQAEDRRISVRGVGVTVANNLASGHLNDGHTIRIVRGNTKVPRSRGARAPAAFGLPVEVMTWLIFFGDKMLKSVRKIYKANDMMCPKVTGKKCTSTSTGLTTGGLDGWCPNGRNGCCALLCHSSNRVSHFRQMDRRRRIPIHPDKGVIHRSPTGLPKRVPGCET